MLYYLKNRMVIKDYKNILRKLILFSFLFPIEIGDIVVISTFDSSYVEKAKK